MDGDITVNKDTISLGDATGSDLNDITNNPFLDINHNNVAVSLGFMFHDILDVVQDSKLLFLLVIGVRLDGDDDDD